MLQSVKDFLFPKQCFCGSPLSDEASLCPECWDKMEFLSSNICARCGFPHEHNFGDDTLCQECIQKSPEFDKARFVFKYNDFSGKFITSFKYADKTYLSEILSKLLIAQIKKEKDFSEFDFIVSVPISKSRLIKRKFNQSAILANKIGHKLSITVDNLMITRVKNVPPQTGLKRTKRLTNVKGVFKISNKYENNLENSRVILIDDVFTTGATINECSKVLKQAGAEEVFALTLARTFVK